MMRPLLALAVVVAACGCPGPKIPQPSPLPTAEQVIARLAEGRATAKTFKAETTSDYWLGGNRVKGTVLMMGMPGAKARFNGLSPAGGNVLLDLACNGTDFVYVDYQRNCVLTGPCNGASIAQLLHVPLEPDDFFYLAVGQTPTLAGATGTVTWDANHGHEVVELTADSGGQTIVIDARDGRWDVIKSELRGPDGKMIWSVEHKDYDELTGDDTPPTTLRVPGKSWFRAPGQKSDVLVEWNERSLNGVLPAAAFTLVPPAGLAACP